MTIDRFRIIGCLASFAMTAISACTTAPPPASTAASIPALATPPSQKPDATEAAIGAALTLAERSRGPGQVAIWSYADEDTTVYLFGTLPFFDANANWRSPTFDRALSIADKVVFEANTLSATAEAQIQRTINDKGLFTDGRLLSGVLSDPVEARLRRAAAELNIPYAALESFKPWLVAYQMDITAAQTSALQSTSDIERTITDHSNDASKSISYLTSVRERLDALGDLPIETQIDRLTVAAISSELGSTLSSALIQEWLDGDESGLEALTATPLVQGGDAAYQSVIVNRNKAWLPDLKALLEQAGTKLVILDSAHLLGPSGVIALLEADGISVSRE